MTAQNHNTETGFVQKWLSRLVNRPGRVVFGMVVVTAVLLATGITFAPEGDVSFDPGGEVFATAELVETTFRPSTRDMTFITEDDGGDALDRATLAESKRNADQLRTDGELSPAFSTYYHRGLDRTVVGFYSIVDAVDDELRGTGVAGLDQATDDQVKIALSNVLSEDRPTVIFRDMLSRHATAEQQTVSGQSITLWSSPAFISTVRVDHSAFPVDLESASDPATRTDAETIAIDGVRSLEIEQWARDAQSTFRGDQQNFALWGVVIDHGLTGDESFMSTVPFLLGAIVLIVLLVGTLLRSYWAAALAGAGLGVTLIWARMINNLLGFEDSLILDLIVPIATISFGVDFFIHAVGRIREELATGVRHRSAYAVGIAAVGGALVLALSTSSIAFASNATSSVEAITQFGFGAAISLTSAFIVLGILAPLFLLRIEEAVTVGGNGAKSPVARIVSGGKLVVAALVAGVSIIAVLVLPAPGTGIVILYTALFLGLPVWVSRRRINGTEGNVAPDVNTSGQSSALAGTLVTGIARMRYAALGIVAVITIVASFGATGIENRTEPTDFFPSNSELIVSINKIVEHTSTASPGDVYVYVEGDLSDPRTLAAAATANDAVDRDGGDSFTRNPDGTLAISPSALDIARAAVAIDFARNAVSQERGVTLTDEDGDGFPDTTAQVEALFGYVVQNGLPADSSTFVFTVDEVSMLLQGEQAAWATVLRYPFQGFPDTERVAIAQGAVEAAMDEFRATTSASGLVLQARVSGNVVAEQVSIDSVTDAMMLSVPLAMVLCIIVAALVMGSVRFAMVSVVPIALVIVWLLGFMVAFDYNINVITATIAAISIGVGIDFSIHYTMRFREELASGVSRIDAVRLAAEGTGTALMLSGSTSIVGFGLLSLAPMPIFAAYGLLTAVMVGLSLLAALTVLPSLLFIVSREPATELVSEEISESVPALA